MGSFLVRDSAVLTEQRISGATPQCDLPIFMMHGTYHDALADRSDQSGTFIRTG